MPAPAAPPTPSPERQQERRRYLMAGLVMALAIVGLALLVGLLADDPPASRQRTDRSAEKPQIIPQPGSGQAPEQPGDPGGWQQGAVFAVMVVGLATLVFLAWRSSVRARRRNASRHRTVTRPTLQKPEAAP